MGNEIKKGQDSLVNKTLLQLTIMEGTNNPAICSAGESMVLKNPKIVGSIPIWAIYLNLGLIFLEGPFQLQVFCDSVMQS